MTVPSQWAVSYTSGDVALGVGKMIRGENGNQRNRWMYVSVSIMEEFAAGMTEERGGGVKNYDVVQASFNSVSAGVGTF